MSSSKIKVYELAKELGQDPQNVVDVVQRLGIDIKNSMSVLGTEEVRTVREHYRRNRQVTKSVAAAQAASKAPVTEKRVGATVIRRRAVDSKKGDAGTAAHEAPQKPTAAEAKARGAEAPGEHAARPHEEPTADHEAQAEAAPETEAMSAADETRVEETAATKAVPPPAASRGHAKVPLRAQVRKPAAAPKQAEEKPAPPAASPTASGQKPQAPEPQASAPAPASEQTAAPAKAPEPERKPRRIYPSIIKKVSTDQHLAEVVGPKLERVKPVKPPQPATSAAKPKPGTPQTAAGAVGLGGPKRVKEIELVAPQTEAQREANRRRSMQSKDSAFRSADYLKRELVHATKKRKAAIARPALKTQLTQAAAHKRVVEMGDAIQIAELAKEMGVKATAVIAKLMGMGSMVTINQAIDFDTASLVAHEFKFEVKQTSFKEEDVLPQLDLAAEKLEPRAPVVTIMGHVDHGKTSLLDAIRKTKVAAGEAGGITQHVGAYTVQVPKGKITFIDTPGHEAFTAMRARGAKVTDVVILVVSAVDGVMPQTIESINHAKAANVPLIVAVNKIDLPDANPDRVKQTLAGHGLTPEEWGGDTIYVPVSAKTGQGLDQLLDSILLQAELLELKANYSTPARGSVIESRLDKNRGPIASVLIQHGKLEAGQIVVCGTTFGKVRAMTNSFGQKVTEALPSEPVEILGLPEVPQTGDEILVVQDERSARELTSARLERAKAKASEAARPKLSLEDMLAAAGGEKEVRVILKADVQGSAEALREALGKLPQDKVKLKILHVATGGITESDVMLASASKAAILGFNVRPDVKASKLAEQERIEVRSYNIIYDLLEDARKLLEGMLDTTTKEKVIGRAEVREIFNVPKVGTIAGSAVIDGKVQRGCYLRLLRDSRVIYEGKISSLRRFKEDVKEVAQGFECGIGLENFNDLKLGDQFEAFVKEEIKGVL